MDQGHPNGVSIVKGEIHRCMAAMRSNQRWASDARFRQEIPLQLESSLLRGFKSLHQRLQAFSDLGDVDTVMYLSPFLDVIVADDTSGVITSMALSSVNKFLLYGFVTPESPRAHEAINRVVAAATACRFEPTGQFEDEATLVRLLELLGNCVRGPAGALLTDAHVWDAAQCCFRIASMERCSHLLQRTSQSALTQAVLHVFSRLHELLEAEGAAVAAAAAAATPAGGSTGSVAVAAGHMRRHAPYGVGVLARLMAWLAGLVEPRAHPRATRVMALEVLNIVLETGGDALGRVPRIVGVCQGDLCRNLIQLSRTSDLPVLALALRLVFNLFSHLKAHLKVQLEVFFTSVHLFLADSRGRASAEQRELALESLVEFCREPTLMRDLYVNYDCDVACTNLFETLGRCMCHSAVPDSGSALTSLHTLALEGMLAILRGLAAAGGAGAASRPADGADAAPSVVVAAAPGENGGDLSPLTVTAALGGLGAAPELHRLSQMRAAEVLRLRKQLKRRLALASQRFNTDAKHWIEYAQELALLPTPADAPSVARFLRDCPGLDRTLIGLYISEPEDAKHAFQTAVRSSYIDSFDFAGLRLDAALRVFLESFRLPGEAQKIERLMQAFATRVWTQERGPMRHPDTPFVLAYSIIMLNTDLHNRTVKKANKMTLEQFLRNNRGIDDGADLPPAFLTSIYESILRREIQMRADVPSTTHASGAGAGGGAAGGSPAGGSVGGSSQQGATLAPMSSDGRSGGGGADDPHDSDGDAAIAAAVGSHWDGVLQRQAAVSAYTPSVAPHGITVYVGNDGSYEAGGSAAAAEASEEAAAHARDMFSLIAEPCIRALAVVFEATTDPAVLKRVVQGFADCAALASQHGLDAHLNQVVIELVRQTTRGLDGLCDAALLHDDPQLLRYAGAVTYAYVRAAAAGPPGAPQTLGSSGGGSGSGGPAAAETPLGEDGSSTSAAEDPLLQSRRLSLGGSSEAPRPPLHGHAGRPPAGSGRPPRASAITRGRSDGGAADTTAPPRHAPPRRGHSASGASQPRQRSGSISHDRRRPHRNHSHGAVGRSAAAGQHQLHRSRAPTSYSDDSSDAETSSILAEMADAEQRAAERAEAAAAGGSRADEPSHTPPRRRRASSRDSTGSSSAAAPLSASSTQVLASPHLLAAGYWAVAGGAEGEGDDEADADADPQPPGAVASASAAAGGPGRSSLWTSPHISRGTLALRRVLLALRCTLIVAADHANGLRESWRNVVHLLQRLAGYDALPPGCCDIDDFRAPNGMLLPSAADPPRSRGDADDDDEGADDSSAAAAAAADDDPVAALPRVLSGNQALAELVQAAQAQRGQQQPHHHHHHAHGGGGGGHPRLSEALAPAPSPSRRRALATPGKGSAAAAAAAGSGGGRGRSGSRTGVWGSLSAFFGGGRSGAAGHGAHRGRHHKHAADATAAVDTILLAVAAEAARTGAIARLWAGSGAYDAASLAHLLQALVSAQDPAALSGYTGGSGAAPAHHGDGAGAGIVPPPADEDAAAAAHRIEEAALHALLSLETLTGLALRNTHRLDVVWPLVGGYCRRVVTTVALAPEGPSSSDAAAATHDGSVEDLCARACALLVERTVVNCLRVGMRAQAGIAAPTATAAPASPSPRIAAPSAPSPLAVACEGLGLLISVPLHRFPSCAPRLAAGVALHMRLLAASAAASGGGAAGDAAVGSGVNDGDALFGAWDVAFAALDACKPSFFAAPAVWEAHVYAASLAATAAQQASAVDQMLLLTGAAAPVSPALANAGPLLLPGAAASGLALALRLHRHVFALTLASLCHYLHTAAHENTVAGAAAAILLGDTLAASPAGSEGASGSADGSAGSGGPPPPPPGGIILSLLAASSPHRPRAPTSPPSVAGGGGGGGGSRFRQQHGGRASGIPHHGLRGGGSGGGGSAGGRDAAHGAALLEAEVRAVTAISSDMLLAPAALSAPLPPPAAAGSAASFERTMRRLVVNEPMSDLREFTAQAALKLLEQMAHSLAPGGLLVFLQPAGAGGPIASSTAAADVRKLGLDAVDGNWLALATALAAAIGHYTPAAAVAVLPASSLGAVTRAAAAYDATAPPLPLLPTPPASRPLTPIESASLARTLPFLRRSLGASLQRTLLAAPAVRITTLASGGGSSSSDDAADVFVAPPLQGGPVWAAVFDRVLLPLLGRVSGLLSPPSLVGAAGSGAQLTLEAAEHIIAVFNVTAQTAVRAMPVLRRDAGLLVLALPQAAADPTQQRLPPARGPESFCALWVALLSSWLRILAHAELAATRPPAGAPLPHPPTAAPSHGFASRQASAAAEAAEVVLEACHNSVRNVVVTLWADGSLAPLASHDGAADPRAATLRATAALYPLLLPILENELAVERRSEGGGTPPRSLASPGRSRGGGAGLAAVAATAATTPPAPVEQQPRRSQSPPVQAPDPIALGDVLQAAALPEAPSASHGHLEPAPTNSDRELPGEEDAVAAAPPADATGSDATDAPAPGRATADGAAASTPDVSHGAPLSESNEDCGPTATSPAPTDCADRGASPAAPPAADGLSLHEEASVGQAPALSHEQGPPDRSDEPGMDVAGRSPLDPALSQRSFFEADREKDTAADVEGDVGPSAAPALEEAVVVVVPTSSCGRDAASPAPENGGLQEGPCCGDTEAAAAKSAPSAEQEAGRALSVPNDGTAGPVAAQDTASAIHDVASAGPEGNPGHPVEDVQALLPLPLAPPGLGSDVKAAVEPQSVAAVEAPPASDSQQQLQQDAAAYGREAAPPAARGTVAGGAAVPAVAPSSSSLWTRLVWTFMGETGEDD